MLNLLFESGEILKQKAKEIEEKNIIALRETNREIKELLTKLKTPAKHKAIYVHDNAHCITPNAFPVDHRIVKV